MKKATIKVRDNANQTDGDGAPIDQMAYPRYTVFFDKVEMRNKLRDFRSSADIFSG